MSDHEPWFKHIHPRATGRTRVIYPKLNGPPLFQEEIVNEFGETEWIVSDEDYHTPDDAA